MSCSNCDCYECSLDREEDEAGPESYPPESDPFWDEMDDESIFAQEVEAVVPRPIPLPMPSIAQRITEFRKPESEPLTPERRAGFEKTLDGIYAKYGDQTRVNMSTLVSVLVSEMPECDMQNYSKYCAQAQDFLRAKAADANSGYGLFKGRNGGFMKIPAELDMKDMCWCGLKKSNCAKCTNLDKQLSKLDSEDSTKSKEAINNHTCVSCGNDRCNNQEKSCWKCGHPIQG